MEVHRLLANRYRVLEQLGSGRWATIWRGHDERAVRPIVISILDSALASDVALRDRIRQETQAAAGIAHPNVASVYDYAETVEPDGTVVPFVVSAFVEGESMAARLAGGQLLWQMAVEAIAQTAAGLSAAHAKGVVHRDISPTSIVFTDDGTKLVDFGISGACRERVSVDRGPGVAAQTQLLPLQAPVGSSQAQIGAAQTESVPSQAQAVVAPAQAQPVSAPAQPVSSQALVDPSRTQLLPRQVPAGPSSAQPSPTPPGVQPLATPPSVPASPVLPSGSETATSQVSVDLSKTQLVPRQRAAVPPQAHVDPTQTEIRPRQVPGVTSQVPAAPSQVPGVPQATDAVSSQVPVDPSKTLLVPVQARGLPKPAVSRSSSIPSAPEPLDCAPELLAGAPGGTPFDVYALGLALYQAIAGVPPWSPETIAGMVQTREYVEPEMLPLVPGLPPEIVALCGSCLAREPQDRPGAIEVAGWLADVIGVTVAIVDPSAETEADGQPLVLPETEVIDEAFNEAPTQAYAEAPSRASGVRGVATAWLHSLTGVGRRLFRRENARHYARPPISRGMLFGVWTAVTVAVVGLVIMITSMGGRGIPAPPAVAAQGLGHVPSQAGVVPGNGPSQGAVVLDPPSGGVLGSPVPPVEASRSRSAAASRTPSRAATASAAGAANTPATPPPTSASPPRPDRSCAATFSLGPVWGDGATLGVKVANTGVLAYDNWSLSFNLPNGLRIAQGGWGGNWSQSGSTVTVRNAGYNSKLAPGQSLQPGVNVNGPDPKRAGAAGGASLNGTACAAG